MIHTLKAEWTKIRSVRSTKWSLAATAIVTLGITTLATGLFTAHWDTLSPENRSAMQTDAIGLILQPAISFSQILVCVLAVLVITSEFSTGTIKSSILAVPRRRSMVLAKGAVLLGVVALMSEALAFGSFFIGQAIVSRHVDIGIGDPGVLRAILCYGVYLMVVAAFVYGLGLMIRHTAAAITAALFMVYILPVTMSLVPGRLGMRINSLLPASNNAQAVLSTNPVPDYLFAPAAALGIFGLWALASVTAGTVLLKQRDV